MRAAVVNRIFLCAILVGVALVAVGIGAGALSTPSLLIGTEPPKGIVWVLIGLWIVVGGAFGLTSHDRAHLWKVLTTFAIPGFAGASHLAMKNESMSWIALGLGIFAVSAALTMLMRPKGATLHIPLAVIVLSLASAAFAYTRPVPTHPNLIPAHMMPAERPE